MSVQVVTGATGHLGNVLVRHLLERAEPVRAVVQAGDDRIALRGLDVEIVEGDVTSERSIEDALRGADVVYHLAGIVSITAGHERLLERVNVEGTRNVARACRRAGARRLVYVSSLHALVEPGDGTLDESGGFDPERVVGAYARSKAAASRELQRAAQDGELDAVLVLPTGVVGPFDFRPSEIGELIFAVARHRRPVIIEGAHAWIDVRDVARGLCLAADRGRSGEAYLINGGRLTTRELCETVAHAAGVPPPRVVLPTALARPISLVGLGWERLTHRRALITPYALHVLGTRWRVDDGKARRELGFTSGPLDRALIDAHTFLTTHPDSPFVRGARRVGPARETPLTRSSRPT